MFWYFRRSFICQVSPTPPECCGPGLGGAVLSAGGQECGRHTPLRRWNLRYSTCSNSGSQEETSRAGRGCWGGAVWGAVRTQSTISPFLPGWRGYNGTGNLRSFLHLLSVSVPTTRTTTSNQTKPNLAGDISHCSTGRPREGFASDNSLKILQCYWLGQTLNVEEISGYKMLMLCCVQWSVVQCTPTQCGAPRRYSALAAAFCPTFHRLTPSFILELKYSRLWWV